MTELIPLSQYILLYSAREWSAVKRLSSIIGYAEFLIQPLKLGFFIPCDENGNILKEPIESDYNLGDIHSGYFHQKCKEFRAAKDKVLFMGFQQYDDNDCAVFTGDDEMIYVDDEFCENMTIEKFMTTITSTLKLTESAIKKYYL